MPQTRSFTTRLIVLTLVAVPLAYWSTLRDYTLGPKLLVWQLVLAVVLLSWICAKDHPIRLPKLAFPALIYIAIALLTSPSATHSDVAYLETTKLITGFLFFIVLSNHLTPQNIPQILTASVWTGILVAILGICDSLNWRPFAIPSAGLPSATLGFRNIAAMYLIQNIPWALALFVLTQKHRATGLHALAIALMGAFLINTRTRGAWLGISIAAIVVVCLWYKTRASQPAFAFSKTQKTHLATAIALLIMLGTLPSGMQKYGPQSLDEKKTTLTQTLFSITQEGGDRGRLIVWRNTLPLIADHVWFGIGPGNWAVHYPKYDHGQLITFDAAPERPHNTFLAIASETGCPGLIAYLWFCVAVLHTGWRHLKTVNAQTRTMALSGLASFIAILIHSFFSFPNERITPTLFFWLVPGIFAATDQKEKTLSPTLSKSVIALLFIIICIQLIFTRRVIQFESEMYQAVLAEKSSDWDQVANHTAKALSYGTFHVEALHLRGYALNTLGDFSTALTHYQKAIAKRPYDIQILNGLAIAAQNSRQYDLAQNAYRQALALFENTDTRYNLAGLFLQSGHPDQAATEYERVLKSESPSLDLYYHLSLAYLLSNQSNQAHDILRRAFALVPDKAEVHFQWIETLYPRHRNPSLVSHYYAIFIKFWPNAQDRDLAQKRLRQLQNPTP